jgi:hypothetical protein
MYCSIVKNPHQATKDSMTFIGAGLLLCRVALGATQKMSESEFLAGKSKQVLSGGQVTSVTVSGSGGEFYIVSKPDQVSKLLNCFSVNNE